MSTQLCYCIYRPKKQTHKGVATMVTKTRRTIKELEAICGSLSVPSKMPGRSTSIPAKYCITGSKLVKIPGSVCHGCYALKNTYTWKPVQKAMEFRFAQLRAEGWTEAMAELITRQSPDYFRWHDSGDLQGIWHLENIIKVCELTPNTKHWLPTREYPMVKQYLMDGGKIPTNLSIRLSAHMVDGAPPVGYGMPVSTVLTSDSETNWNCPSRHQGNVCGDCRACWDPSTRNVSYHKH